MKDLGSQETIHSPMSDVGDVMSIGDFDRDGYHDIVMTMPKNSTNGVDSGAVFLFWGGKDGFPALEPYNADIILTGEEFFLFGQDVAAWDYAGDTWADLVISCPGALGGTGKLLVYESTDINIALKGAVIDTSQAVFEIAGNNTHFFGSHLEVGDMTGDGIDDLMVLSMAGEGVIPRFEMFSGGVIPDFGYEVELPVISVKNSTRTASLDFYGTGQDAFVYSSPDNGEVRVIKIDVSFDPYSFPGANETAVVDFQGSIESTGNTFGWGAGDDGWDTSPTHIYDSSTGYDSVRYNQQTGNANGADRSIGVENQLFIEVGGVLTNSNERDQSGAYGVSFQLSPQNITGINSAILSFDYEYEDWGFEQQERMWVKGRWTDSTGDITWLGSGMDRNPEPDLTPEIFTLAGQTNNNGPTIFGRGTFKTDVLRLLDGPGEYYLDMGGKVSRWTASNEFAGFGFDNITLTFRSLSHEVQKIMGSGGLGSGLLAADTDRDGKNDLLIGSPQQGVVRIFKGYQPYWSQMSGLNQGMCNSTIEGVPNSGMGTSMARLGTSPFNLVPSIAISAPSNYVGSSSLGTIYVFNLPIPEGTVHANNANEVNPAPAGTKYYGWRIIPVGDHDGNLYPELLLVSWTWNDKLMTTLTDRSPSFPMLWILNPRRHDTVSGNIDIVARIFDIDNDTYPEDVRFYRSTDNRSWNPIGDGTPDHVEGDTATKYWNTTLFGNGGYFLKVAVTDSFGLETVKYTDRVDVLNHAPPFVKLLYPADGTELRWVEEITAKVLVPSSEELDPPVRFFYSRDNTTWTEFANRSSPVEGSTSDFLAEFDTEVFTDGPLWFKVNASVVYGLGSESRNIAPAYINNSYPPEGTITKPYPGSTISGVFNITIQTVDPDDDIVDPVEVYIKEPDVETWDLIGNMIRWTNGTFFFQWDTTTVDNGKYDIMIRVVDSADSQIELRLNQSVTVHNLYKPSVVITSHEGDEVLVSLVTFVAVIDDRDMNIRENDIRFIYRPEGLDIWNPMGRAALIGNRTEVTWDTREVKNGLIDVRVEVTDMDNLTAMYQITGIRVKNIYAPLLDTDLPSFSTALSGVVRIAFNVSDDEPIPPVNLKVEVLVRTTWMDIGNVSRLNPGGEFIPDQWVSYYIDWNTLQKGSDGKRLFPDGIGYDIKITVTDSDGETVDYITPVSYRIRNDDSGGDDDDDTGGLAIEGWLIAVLVIAGVVVFIVILLLFMFRGDKKIKEPVPKVTMPPPRAALEETKPTEAPLTPVEGRDGGIYSPPGWEGQAPSAPPEDVPMFTADAGEVDLGIDLGIEAEPEAEDLTDLRDQFFGAKKGKPKKMPRKRVPEAEVKHIEDRIDVVLPEGVVPPTMGALKKKTRPKEEPEEWAEEEEDWDVLDEEEIEELEEDEEWEDVEEDEWEDDEEEEEEEELVVTCKCGEEIEIPPEFKGTKFRCPSCGRKGTIPGR
ncbi:MAG: hypothetical protein ACMUHU_06690 [Thermoplasmatota archaeon]